jgi:hypothetical protein
MERIECQWCHEQNTPDRTDCDKCGAPLDINDRVGGPAPMPPPPQWSYPPAPSYPYPVAPPLGRARVYRVWQLLWIVVFIGIVLAGIGYLTKFKNPFSPGSAQFQTADGLNGLLGQIRNRFGDTMGYKLTVYPTYAIVDRVDPQNNRYDKSYLDRAGKWSDFGGSSLPLPDSAVADLSKFDATAVTAKLPGAAQSLGVSNVKYTYLLVEGVGDGSLKVSIYVSDGVTVAYMELNPDGSVKDVHPPI